jgi:FkbM family methyltransferase
MASPRTLRLPNGLDVFSLSKDDTMMIYTDIFDDDCYRLHGATIQDGDCIFDVGANTGLFLLFLNQILKSARVLSFEPIPKTFEVLSLNAQKHNHLDLSLFNAGLSDRAGQATFEFYPRMSNASTMYPDHTQEAKVRGYEYIMGRFKVLPKPLAWFIACLPGISKRRLAVRVRRFYFNKEDVTCDLMVLSDVIRDHKVERIDLLKIDAEQAEEHILAGIRDADWPKVQQIIVECHYGEARTQAIVEMFQRRGFRTTIDSNPAFPTLLIVYAVRENHRRRERQGEKGDVPTQLWAPGCCGLGVNSLLG